MSDNWCCFFHSRCPHCLNGWLTAPQFSWADIPICCSICMRSRGGTNYIASAFYMSHSSRDECAGNPRVSLADLCSSSVHHSRQRDDGIRNPDDLFAHRTASSCLSGKIFLGSLWSIQKKLWVLRVQGHLWRWICVGDNLHFMQKCGHEYEWLASSVLGQN